MWLANGLLHLDPKLACSQGAATAKVMFWTLLQETHWGPQTIHFKTWYHKLLEHVLQLKVRDLHILRISLKVLVARHSTSLESHSPLDLLTPLRLFIFGVRMAPAVGCRRCSWQLIGWVVSIPWGFIQHDLGKAHFVNHSFNKNNFRDLQASQQHISTE